MALTYGFYNSIGGDRRYSAEDMSSIFDGIINDGVFMSVGDALIVTAPGGMNVGVGTGRAWFNHTWTNNDTDIVLPLDPAGVGLGRIDAVVLEINSDDNTRANSIKVIKGTPSGSPVAPTLLSTEDVHQYPLAYVNVAAGVTQILTADITNKVGSSDCPFVTGILETMDTDALVAQWNDEFTTWFNSIGDILDSNTAGNLLTMINANTASINNISYSTPTDYSQLFIPLSTSTLKGVLQAIVKGNTYYNLLGAYGNFEVDTNADGIADGWTENYNSLTGITKFVSTTKVAYNVNKKAQKIVADGTNSATNSYRLEYTLPTITGHKYYISAWFFVTVADKSGLGIDNNTIDTVHPANMWIKKSTILVGDGSNHTIKLYLAYNNPSTALTSYVDSAIAVDLTPNLLDTLTVAQCDDIFPYNIGATKSTAPQRVRSVGKNWFNYLTNFMDYTTGGSTRTIITNGIDMKNDGTQASGYSSHPIKLKPNTIYTLSCTHTRISGTSSRFAVYNPDRSAQYAATMTTGNQSVTFTTSSQGWVSLLFYSNFNVTEVGEAKYTNIQLEIGSVATAYEAYKESLAYTPDTLELRGVNSTKDTFNFITGAYTKNVNQKIIQTSDVTGMNTARTNLDWALIPKSGSLLSDSILSGNILTGKALLEGYNETFSDDVASNIGCFGLNTSPSYIYVGFAKGTSLATAQAALAGKTLTYVLSNSVITQYQPQDLIEYTNGNIIVDNIVRDAVRYTANAAVSNTTYPISTLDRVYKVSYSVDEEIILNPIDISTCTVATNGLSFTSTALSNGDSVIYEYSYSPSASTVPTTNISYPTSLRAEVDGNTDGIAALQLQVNNIEVAGLNRLADILKSQKRLKLGVRI